MTKPIKIEFQAEGISETEKRIDAISSRFDNMKNRAGSLKKELKGVGEATSSSSKFGQMASQFVKTGAAAVILQQGVRLAAETVEDYIKAAEETPELFTADELARAKALGSSVDDLKGSFTKLKISIVDANAEGLTKFANGLSENIDKAVEYDNALEKMEEGQEKRRLTILRTSQGGLREYSNEAILAIQNQDRAQRESALVAEEVGKIWEGIYEDRSEANRGLLSLIGSMQSAEDKYQSNAEKLAEERIQIEQDRAEEIAKGFDVNIEKVGEYDEALAENSRKVEENKQDHENANREIMLGLIERKFLADGQLDDKEFNYLMDSRLNWGLWSADVVAEAKAAWEEADKISASVAAIPDKEVNITIKTYREEIATKRRDAGRGEQEFASGTDGWLTVPPGYPDDTYPISVSSGEKFAVIPQGENVPKGNMTVSDSSGLDTNSIVDAIVKGISMIQVESALTIDADGNDLARFLKPKLDRENSRVGGSLVSGGAF